MSDSFPARDAIEARQLESLRALLSEIIPNNAFYTTKLTGSGVDGRLASLRAFTSAAPFTWKHELVKDQQSAPPYGTNLTYPIIRYTRCHQTSGTSGSPLRWLDTPESWSWMVDNWAQVFRAAGATATDSVYFAFSFGPFLGFWTAFEAALRIGCLCTPGGGMSSEARLASILDQGATILCCTPTYALRLAEVATKSGISLAGSKVRTILVAGEPGGSIPAVRRRIEDAWRGTRVFDHHGMTEVGPVTFECPCRPGVLHAIEPEYLAEIVDPLTGDPKRPGEVGELVLSTLGRTGSPLLRYRTGDLVKADPDPLCACGRSNLALDGGILGRADDMVIVRGVNVYPSAVDELVRRIPEIVEYQVHLTTRNHMSEIRVQIEPEPGYRNPLDLGYALERSFESSLALRVQVEVLEPGTLPRFEMKARRWFRDP